MSLQPQLTLGYFGKDLGLPERVVGVELKRKYVTMDNLCANPNTHFTLSNPLTMFVKTYLPQP